MNEGSNIKDIFKNFDKKDTFIKIDLLFGKNRKLIGEDNIFVFRDKFFYEPLQKDFLYIDSFDSFLFRESPYKSFALYLFSKILPFSNILLNINPIKNIDFIDEIPNFLKVYDITVFEKYLKELVSLRVKIEEFQKVKIPTIIEQKRSNLNSSQYKKVKLEIEKLKKILSQESNIEKKEILEKEISNLVFEQKLIADTLQFEKKLPEYKIEYEFPDLYDFLSHLKRLENDIIEIIEKIRNKNFLVNSFNNLISDFNILIENMKKEKKNFISIFEKFPFFTDNYKNNYEIFSEINIRDTIKKTLNILNSFLNLKIEKVVLCDFSFYFDENNFYFVNRG